MCAYPVLLEDLVHLLHVQALALGQEEEDEEGGHDAAGGKEQEHPAGRSEEVRGLG